MPTRHHLSLLDILSIFFATALFAFLMLALWSQTFAGNWCSVNARNEVANALILGTVLATLVIVLRYLAANTGRTLMLLGLSLLSVQSFLELPLKKYAATTPGSGVSDWFFFFGMAEFVSMMLVLSGVTYLMRSKRKNI